MLVVSGDKYPILMDIMKDCILRKSVIDKEVSEILHSRIA
jgi:hypothetical protein